ncbi:MAG: hypothetical protein WBJ81_03765 [Rickettsiales bacterium]
MTKDQVFKQGLSLIRYGLQQVPQPIENHNKVEPTQDEKQIIEQSLSLIKKNTTQQQLRVMQMIISAAELSIVDYANLSEIKSNFSRNMYFMASPLRALRNIDNYRGFIEQKIKTHIQALQSQQVILSPINPLTPNKTAALLNDMAECLCEVAVNSIKAMDTAFRSDKLVVAVVDTVIKSFMSGAVDGNFSLQNTSKNAAKTSITKAVDLHIEQQHLNESDLKQTKISEIALKKGVKFMVDNAEKGFIKAVSLLVKSSLNEVGKKILEEHLIPVIAASASLLMLSTSLAGGPSNVIKLGLEKNLDKVLTALIARNIGRSVYKYGWKVNKGDIALKDKDLNKAINAYLVANGMKEVAKQYVPIIAGVIIKEFSHYISNEHAKTKDDPKKCSEAKILLSALEAAKNSSNILYEPINFSTTTYSDALIGYNNSISDNRSSVTTSVSNLNLSINNEWSYTKAIAPIGVALAVGVKWLTRVGKPKDNKSKTR